MIEKVNPSHPDKLADRIGGAIVDLAYREQKNPKVAVEVLLGHDECHVIIEWSLDDNYEYRREIKRIVDRIVPTSLETIRILIVKQDEHLAHNQQGEIKCGDNGIFKGLPIRHEERVLGAIARRLYEIFPYDGKYVYDETASKLIICQSNAINQVIQNAIQDLIDLYEIREVVINPLGAWVGGVNVDTGAINRKLGSDMAFAVTGGGMCLSGDTEYLAEDLKWHKIENYKGGKVAQWNEGRLEFVQPTQYIHNPLDKFIHFHNDTKLDMMLTPNHEMLIKTSKNNLIKRNAEYVANKLARHGANCGSILHNFIYNRHKNSVYSSVNEYKLQVAFCADGSVLKSSDNARWTGRIRVKKERKKQALREILNNIEHKETVDGEYSIFWVKPRHRSKSLYECFVNEDWAILRQEVFKWDGAESKKIFRTTNKEDADFIQLVIQSYGDVASLTCDNRIGRERVLGDTTYVTKSICYNVQVVQSVQTGLRNGDKSNIKVDYIEEQQPSYCFNVPSHNLIVRRNNRIFITGNCGKDLSKADVTLNIYAHMLAQFQQQPIELYCAIGDTHVNNTLYSDIVQIVAAYVKDKGGFEKFAEWGLF